MSSTPKKKDLKKNKLDDCLERFKRAQMRTYGPLLKEMSPYVPFYTSYIIKSTVDKLASVLELPNATDDILSEIYDFLVMMIRKSKENDFINDPEAQPYKELIASQEMLHGLFMRLGVDEEHESIDHRIVKIINYLFAKMPMEFVDFLTINQDALMPLMKSIVTTKDVKAGHLFQQLAVSNPTVLDQLVVDIQSKLREYPVSVVIDFIVADKRFQQVIPENELGEWLLEHDLFTLSDVEIVCKYFQFIWLNDISAKLMLRTPPPVKYHDVQWIKDCKPQSFDLSLEDTRAAVSSIMNPQYKFYDITYTKIQRMIHFNTRELYMFVRLYVLSHARPENVPKEAIEFLYKLIHDPSTLISTAAVQMFTYWISCKDFPVDRRFVFLLAFETYDKSREDSVSNLFKACLHILSQKIFVAEAILRSEATIRYNSKSFIQVKRSEWMFPHMVQIIKNAPNDPNIFSNENVAASMGYMLNYLNAGDNFKELIVKQAKNENQDEES